MHLHIEAVSNGCGEIDEISVREVRGGVCIEFHDNEDKAHASIIVNDMNEWYKLHQLVNTMISVNKDSSVKMNSQEVSGLRTG